MERLPELVVTLPIDRASVLFAEFVVYYGQRRRHQAAPQAVVCSTAASTEEDVMRNAEVVDQRPLFQTCAPHDTTDKYPNVSSFRPADRILYASARYSLFTSHASYQVVAKEHAPLNLCKHSSLESPEQLHLL